MPTRALVGTRKGLFTLVGDGGRSRWQVEALLLDGWAIYHATVDPRDGTWYAAANHRVYGPTVQRSTDAGRTWNRTVLQPLPPEMTTGLNAVWRVEPGRPEEPATLYAGADPAVLLRSSDGGQSWQPNQALLEHRTRHTWVPTAGGLSCHAIVLDPRDRLRMYVAISSGGVFRTHDGGESWTPLNRGVEIDMMPDPYPEAGQCVHMLRMHPALPDRLWQQNHCGVYRSDDGGDSWERVDHNGLPTPFGYPLMLDPKDPDTAVVIPEKSYEYHYTPENRMGVYRTRDKGQTWSLLSDGLPQPAWAAVLREASAFDAESLYFGTQSGSFFVLTDDRWVEAVRQLPPILSIEVPPWSG
jgi:photosystem II stability/assembly factor-like uncharacterized protein